MAKGGPGGGRGRGSRGGYRSSSGSYYDGGGGSFDWTLLVGVIIGIGVFCFLCWICCPFCCCSDEENERNVRHDSNGINIRSMVVPKKSAKKFKRNINEHGDKKSISYKSFSEFPSCYKVITSSSVLSNFTLAHHSHFLYELYSKLQPWS